VDCAFRPYSAFFDVRRACTVGQTDLTLEHCSGFVFNGPVFRFDQDAGAALQVRRCLFAGNGRQVVPESAAVARVLIRQADNTKIQFQGIRNCYHDLNALWSVGLNLYYNNPEFEGALRRIENSFDQDPISREADSSPWRLEQPLINEDDAQAFQVKADLTAYGIGIRKGFWGDLPQVRAPEIALAPEVNRDKDAVFEPGYQGSLSRVFFKLSMALAAVKKDGTVWIKPGKDGREIELPATELEQACDVTIKAYPKTTPVLTLRKPSQKNHTSFFRVPDGKLRLEGLHFFLDTRQDGVGAQSILALGENAQCTFDRCVITLRATRKVDLSVVSLIDPKDLMMQPAQPRPYNTDVKLNNSFVRGDGDLISVASCRPIQLGLENSLVALSGSLADIQAVAGEDVPAGQEPRFNLKQVSVFTRDPVFSLQCFKNGKGLAKTHVEARACLFGPLGDRPLVYLSASDVVTEDQLTNYLDWTGGQNCFVKFEKLLEQEKPNQMGTVMQLEPMRWVKVFGGAVQTKEDVTFPLRPSDLVLWQAQPEWFRPDDGDKAAGAQLDLDALLKALPAR
jgi:hypothetical protein